MLRKSRKTTGNDNEWIEKARMVNEQYIRCPDCGSQIPFDPYALVRGDRFACPKCPNVSIGMDLGIRDTVKTALDKMQKLKKQMGKRDPNAPFGTPGLKRNDTF